MVVAVAHTLVVVAFDTAAVVVDMLVDVAYTGNIADLAADEHFVVAATSSELAVPASVATVDSKTAPSVVAAVHKVRTVDMAEGAAAAADRVVEFVGDAA